MQHEEIDPLADDFNGARRNKLFEMAHLRIFQRCAPGNIFIADSRDFAIYDDNLGAGLAILAFAVDMHRFVLVGIEHDDQAEVFVELGHHALPSTSAISSSVRPYSAYTNWSICLSVASIWRCSNVVSCGVFAAARSVKFTAIRQAS